MNKLIFLPLLIFISFSLQAQIYPCGQGAPIFYDSPMDVCATCDISALTNFSGNTSAFTADHINDLLGFCLGSTIENNGWMGFVASDTVVEFKIVYSNCVNSSNPSSIGLQAAILQTTNYTDFMTLACQHTTTPEPNDSFSIYTNGASVGGNYLLMIDGFAGSQCDFTVEVIHGVGSPPVGASTPITGSQTVCAGHTDTLLFGPVAGAGSSTWQLPTGSYINGQNPAEIALDPLQPTVVYVNWGYNATTGDICVTPNNGCNKGQQVCLPLTVLPNDTTLLALQAICYGTQFVWIDGETYTADSLLQNPLVAFFDTSTDACDSIVIQEFLINELQVDIPDTSFFIPCDSSLIRLVCNSNPTYSYLWTFPDGSVSTDSCLLLSTNSYGDITLLTTDPLTGCSATSNVALDTPSLTADLSITPASDANTSDGQALATINTNLPTLNYAWYRANVLVAITKDLIDVPSGDYRLVVSDSETGCFLIHNIHIGHVVTTTEPSWAKQVHIYPNPSNGLISLELPKGQYAYSVLSFIGETLLSKKKITEKVTLNMTDFPQGSYLIKVVGADGYSLKKININP